jgi:glucose/arabinose dehydrogenase
LRRVSLIAAGTVVVAVGACQLLLPQRFAVNAPLRQLLFGRGISPPPIETLEQRLQVPSGFGVGRYAEGIPGARLLRFTPAGDLLVSVPREGKIVLLERDTHGRGRAEGTRTLIAGLNRPHGMDLHDGWLYVAETDAIGRVRFDPATRETSGAFERIVTGLPAGGNHWTRTLRFGPDGHLYVSVGSSCNVCLEPDPRRAAMLRFEPDGSHMEIFASGLRNSVGFDWQPGTGNLYATDNGRDLLGDDFPPCELNLVVQGGFYGWPFANGDRVPDPDFGAGHEPEIARSRPPVHGFRPHNAPLGMTFVRGEAAPTGLRGAALVALHGSWNRTQKDGYKVVSLTWGPDGVITERDFLTGFLKDEDVIGRPVDVAEGPDGAFYVSDDYAGSIYRVALGPAPQPEPTTAGSAAPAANPLSALSEAEIAQDNAQGAALFERYGCAGCHVPERAEKGIVAKPLAGLAQRYTVPRLEAFLAAPTPPMPVFPLSESDRRALAVHLLATRP